MNILFPGIIRSFQMQLLSTVRFILIMMLADILQCYIPNHYNKIQQQEVFASFQIWIVFMIVLGSLRMHWV